MSSVALNQVYKTGILALEQCAITASIAAGDKVATVKDAYMSYAPFVVGHRYLLMDDTFTVGANGVPNAEWITVTNISSLVIALNTDGIGYSVTGTLGFTGDGTGGGTVNAYSKEQNSRILTPGQEKVILSADFNCRFKTLTDAPKIDVDDEAERFATGDEGRDQSIPGARSGEITFTEKLAWAGSVSTRPVWEKLMLSMGHLAKTYGIGTPTSPGKGNVGSAYADLDALIAGYSLHLGGKFFTKDGTDTTDGALATAKGSALQQNDSFEVTQVSPSGTVSYLGKAGIGYLPHTWANEITATIWIIMPENGMNPTSTIYRYRGAHGGNGSSISTSKVGDVYMLTAKYSAAYVGTTEIPLSVARVLTAPETNIPETMLNNLVSVPSIYGHIIPQATTPEANCAFYANLAALIAGEKLGAYVRFYTDDGTDTQDGALTAIKGSALVPGDAFTIGGAGTTCSNSQPIKQVEVSQFSLDFGGVVNPFIDQSTSTGNAYYATQDRDPRLSINPYHTRKTLDDIDSVVTKVLTGAVTIQSALSNPHFTIELPNAQLLFPAMASREGYVNTNRVYRALRNKITSSPANADLPDGAMYEILIGARS